LGLFWAFLFFVLLSLIIGMTFLGDISFYPYAVLLSGVLVLLLTGFLLFDKRAKAGFYLCLVLSALFFINQAITMYILLFQPASIIPTQMENPLMQGGTGWFPTLISFLFLLWALLLLVSTWKSKPVFEKERLKEDLKWLVDLREKDKAFLKPAAELQGTMPKQ
jgi:hypothetical protein